MGDSHRTNSAKKDRLDENTYLSSYKKVVNEHYQQKKQFYF
jgi:hypothetical protein